MSRFVAAHRFFSTAGRDLGKARWAQRRLIRKTTEQVAVEFQMPLLLARFALHLHTETLSSSRASKSSPRAPDTNRDNTGKREGDQWIAAALSSESAACVFGKTPYQHGMIAKPAAYDHGSHIQGTPPRQLTTTRLAASTMSSLKVGNAPDQPHSRALRHYIADRKGSCQARRPAFEARRGNVQAFTDVDVCAQVLVAERINTILEYSRLFIASQDCSRFLTIFGVTGNEVKDEQCAEATLVRCSKSYVLSPQLAVQTQDPVSVERLQVAKAFLELIAGRNGLRIATSRAGTRLHRRIDRCEDGMVNESIGERCGRLWLDRAPEYFEAPFPSCETEPQNGERARIRLSGIPTSQQQLPRASLPFHARQYARLAIFSDVTLR
ncbi:hypothetical protein SVAN01_06705 [Stagonosporopsis vannaccii]|nr:hypothetical protein SVAN01_06705 [Stagonosporopsis vannaccii]